MSPAIPPVCAGVAPGLEDGGLNVQPQTREGAGRRSRGSGGPGLGRSPWEEESAELAFGGREGLTRGGNEGSFPWAPRAGASVFDAPKAPGLLTLVTDEGKEAQRAPCLAPAPQPGPLLGSSPVAPLSSWHPSPARGELRPASWGLQGCRRASEWPLVGSTKVELVRAHLGSVSLAGVGGSPVKMELRRLVLHPQYDPGVLDFDVAVLELARPLGFNTFIQPVCLPLAIQKFPVGRKCMISGWGNTQEGNGELPARASGPPPANHSPLRSSGLADSRPRAQRGCVFEFRWPAAPPIQFTARPRGFRAARACALRLFVEKVWRHVCPSEPPEFMLAVEPQSGLLQAPHGSRESAGGRW